MGSPAVELAELLSGAGRQWGGYAAEDRAEKLRREENKQRLDELVRQLAQQDLISQRGTGQADRALRAEMLRKASDLIGENQPDVAAALLKSSGIESAAPGATPPVNANLADWRAHPARPEPAPASAPEPPPLPLPGSAGDAAPAGLDDVLGPEAAAEQDAADIRKVERFTGRPLTPSAPAPTAPAPAPEPPAMPRPDFRLPPTFGGGLTAAAAGRIYYAADARGAKVDESKSRAAMNRGYADLSGANTAAAKAKTEDFLGSAGVRGRQRDADVSLTEAQAGQAHRSPATPYGRPVNDLPRQNAVREQINDRQRRVDNGLRAAQTGKDGILYNSYTAKVRAGEAVPAVVLTRLNSIARLNGFTTFEDMIIEKTLVPMMANEAARDPNISYQEAEARAEARLRQKGKQ